MFCSLSGHTHIPESPSDAKGRKTLSYSAYWIYISYNFLLYESIKSHLRPSHHHPLQCLSAYMSCCGNRWANSIFIRHPKETFYNSNFGWTQTGTKYDLRGRNNFHFSTSSYFLILLINYMIHLLQTIRDATYKIRHFLGRSNNTCWQDTTENSFKKL